MDPTAQILFQYLKDILYQPHKAELDLQTLPADFQKLGMGLQLLAEWIKEADDFSKSLAKGELSKTPPSVDNMLAAPMKALQGSLRHLTWQTQQIAKGDFSQRVDFMGEFSDAFNTMTAQLAERTENLIEEKKRVDSMNLELKKDLDLMQTLTNYAHNMIFVISAEKKEKLFQNRPAEWFEKTRPETAKTILQELSAHQTPQNSDQEGSDQDDSKFLITVAEANGPLYYNVESFSIQWSGIPVVVYIVTDDTMRKRQEIQNYNLAYIDSLTGLNNRRYAIEQMKQLRKDGKDFLSTLIDIDHLKYCNDIYGHQTGDEYLINTAELLKTLHGMTVCRIGGDEFFILEEGTDIQKHDEAIDHLRTLFMKQTRYAYPHSFSFATTLIPANSTGSLEQYISETDKAMYEYKRKHRVPLKDIYYHDDRTE